MIRQIFDLNKDLSHFYRVVTLTVLQLSAAKPYLNAEHFTKFYNSQYCDWKAEAIKGLSLLELCLLIASKKMMEQSKESFNFEQLYDEYRYFSEKYNRNTRLFSPSIALKVYKLY